MTVAEVRVQDIDSGERRREDYGDIAGLAASIKRLGVLEPILIDRNGGRFRLIFGGRRLRAVESLGLPTIPAMIRDTLTDEEFREIELEENEQRKALTEGEKGRRFESSRKLVEQAKRADQLISGNLPEKDPRGRKTVNYTASRDQVAAALNVPERDLRRAEQHVETAAAFPFMQGNPWRQSHVLAVREQLEVIPPDERDKAMGVLECAKILAPTDAVALLDNIGKKTAANREEVYRLSKSEDPRDRSLALTKAAELPPRPDPRLDALRTAIDALERASKPYPKDPLTPRIEAATGEVRKIRAAVKEVSFDATRLLRKEGTVQ